MDVRDLRNEDVPGVVRLLREAYPHDLASEEGFRHALRSVPARARQRLWVAADAGTVVAFGGARLHTLDSAGDNGLARVTVAEAYRGRGLGSELFAAALKHLREAGARTAIVYSGHPEGDRFLERRGFRLTHTLRYSRIDPRRAELAALSRLRSKKEAEGFTVIPFGECRPEDVHAVCAEATLDIPFEAPITEVRLDEWLEQEWRHPLLSLEGSFAAAHGGRIVAITMARVDLAGRRATNDMTATLRAFRGRGLARLLKLCQLEWSAANGITAVIADNDATNAPMLAVNERLGYEPFHEVGSYVRQLD